ncbi:MAG: hypothetical protein ACXWD5_16905 [Mycobacterium sp.]
MWDKVGASLLGMEGDRHQRVRGVVAKAFTPRAVKRLHATIDEIVEIVEPISRRGYCDVVTEIARPYPRQLAKTTSINRPETEKHESPTIPSG